MPFQTRWLVAVVLALLALWILPIGSILGFFFNTGIRIVLFLIVVAAIVLLIRLIRNLRPWNT